MNTITNITTTQELQKAYEGSYYFIAGSGGSLDEWINGYEDLMSEKGIGKPVEWLTVTGAVVNLYVDGFNTNPFKNDLTCLMFPLTGLDVGKLAMFKLSMGDRWFDDVVNNMR